MTDEEAKPETQDTPEVAVCPNCMTENHPLADFCRECGMPLSSLATMDPVKRIYAQGWIYHKAVTVRRPRPIIVLGMWLIFGPLVLTESCCLMGTACSRGSIVSVTYYPLGLIPLTGLFLLYSVILWRVTRNYLRYRGYKPGQCEECGYSLFGLIESRCPECGTPFDPEDLSANADEGIAEEGPKRLLSKVDIGYAVAVGCCYVLLVAATWAEDMRGFSKALRDDVLLASVAGAIAMNLTLWIVGLKFIFGATERRRTWLFWVAWFANMLLTFLVMITSAM